MTKHPIITVAVSSTITAQGPTVEDAEMCLPTDDQGRVAVRTGKNTVSRGVPIEKVSKK